MNKQSSDSNEILVSIHCLVYNHEPYIRDCLEGFVMQKTNFPFEAIVHDDASTDKSADIIREYAEKYPHIIKPIYQTENQYSQKNGAIGRAVNAITRGKYIALCEGDDYWTDPLKLQKQVDFLESHPDYSMSCTDAVVLSPEGELQWPRYQDSQDIPIIDTILNGGLWIHTCSMLYRKYLKKDYPEFAAKCHVGDYPLAIHLALKGKIYFHNEKMVTYRFKSQGSWTSRNQVNEAFYDNFLSEVYMLAEFNKYSRGVYNKIFQKKIGKYIISYLLCVPTMKNRIFHDLSKIIRHLNWTQKIKLWKIRLGIFR